MSAKKGDIVESLFDIKMFELGFLVSKPLNSGAIYDRLVDSGKIYRVQIKSVWDQKNNGMPRLYVRRYKNIKYSESDVDIFVVYEKATDSWFILPNKNIGKSVKAVDKFKDDWDQFKK